MDLVTQILAEQAFTDEMVWSGHPSLFPILHQFKSQLATLAAATEPQCTVWFYVQETLMPKTSDLLVFTFRINASDTVRDVISHVVRRLDIAMPPQRCCLETQAGYRLRTNERMSTYGLGTLLVSWRLELRERRAKARRRCLPPSHQHHDKCRH